MLVARSGVLTGRQVRAADCGEAARGARSGVLTGREEGAGDCGEAAAVFPTGRQAGTGDCGEAAAVSPRGRRGCAGDRGEVAQRVVFAPRLAGVCTGEACCRRFFKAASACKAVSSG